MFSDDLDTFESTLHGLLVCDVLGDRADLPPHVAREPLNFPVNIQLKKKIQGSEWRPCRRPRNCRLN